MEVAELDKALDVVDSCVSRIKWRMKPASKRRLQIDILALCTGMRPVVMVDYGGKMPELQERLCTVLQLGQKESSILGTLRVMVIEDMIYLLNARELSEYVKSSLNSETELLFVDLEQDPPKMMVHAERNPVATELVSIIQKFFYIPVDGVNKDLLQCPRTNNVSKDNYPIGELVTSQSSEFIDLSICMQDSPVTIPTLNGWLLGYPVVYLFGKEHIADAIYNLSMKSLRLFKILICRNGISNRGPPEELMRWVHLLFFVERDQIIVVRLKCNLFGFFSVPYELSMGGKNEPWAEAFLARMRIKLEKSNQAWRDLQMEVSECSPQAIVL